MGRYRSPDTSFNTFLKSAKLNESATSLSISNIPNKKFLELHIFIASVLGSNDAFIRFNSDDGTNYSFRIDQDDTASNLDNQTDINLGRFDSGNNFHVFNIINIPDKNKMFVSSGLKSNRSMIDIVGMWLNSDDAITSITLGSGSESELAINTEMTIFGKNGI